MYYTKSFYKDSEYAYFALTRFLSINNLFCDIIQLFRIMKISNSLLVTQSPRFVNFLIIFPPLLCQLSASSITLCWGLNAVGAIVRHCPLHCARSGRCYLCSVLLLRILSKSSCDFLRFDLRSVYGPPVQARYFYPDSPPSTAYTASPTPCHSRFSVV